MRKRDGFTIIEVLMAVLVLSAGLLALAGSAAVITRLIAQGKIDTRASTLVAQQFEIMRSMPCDSIVPDTITVFPFTVGWTVATTAQGRARQVELEVDQPTIEGSRRTTYATTIFC